MSALRGPDDVTLSFDLTVPSYLCEPDDHLGLSGLASIMQEAAWRSASSLGFDFAARHSPHYWVLHRLTMKALRLPSWSQRVTVTTWPNRIERLYAMREFAIEMDGELAVAGSSAWLIIDAEKRRPMRPEKIIARPWQRCDGPISVPLGRLPTLDDSSTAERVGEGDGLPVRASDMDRNNHVNNARYAQWLLDATPEIHTEWLAAGRELSLTFTAEMRAGDRYQVVADREAGLAEVWSCGGEQPLRAVVAYAPQTERRE